MRMPWAPSGCVRVHVQFAVLGVFTWVGDAALRERWLLLRTTPTPCTLPRPPHIARGASHHHALVHGAPPSRCFANVASSRPRPAISSAPPPRPLSRPCRKQVLNQSRITAAAVRRVAAARAAAALRAALPVETPNCALACRRAHRDEPTCVPLCSWLSRLQSQKPTYLPACLPRLRPCRPTYLLPPGSKIGQLSESRS